MIEKTKKKIITNNQIIIETIFKIIEKVYQTKRYDKANYEMSFDKEKYETK